MSFTYLLLFPHASGRGEGGKNHYHLGDDEKTITTNFTR